MNTKILMPAIIAAAILFYGKSYGQIDIFGKVKNKINQKENQKIDQGIDKGLNKTEEGAKDAVKKKDNEAKDQPGKKEDEKSSNENTAAPAFKSYSNYDFVPGDKILFEDNFADDQDGEFPAHWNLESGQGVINKVAGEPSFTLTEGNYVKVSPRMKTESYLTDPFTVELDFFPKQGAYGVMVFFETSQGEKSVSIKDNGDVSSGSFKKDFNANYPGDRSPAFINKWHHVAIAFKNQQMKCYVDQYRVLVMPNTEVNPTAARLGGIGSLESPIVFKNVRIASGGGMNMIGKKFTESKIVTHGINFDYNKSTIKPESMGTLNMIVKVMQENPELRFEVDGHTDSDGDDAFNMKLSNERAEAVKTQLVSMGIDVSHLTTKGFGETKPISDNNSPEGKANNRRVEFVKI